MTDYAAKVRLRHIKELLEIAPDETGFYLNSKLGNVYTYLGKDYNIEAILIDDYEVNHDISLVRITKEDLLKYESFNIYNRCAALKLFDIYSKLKDGGVIPNSKSIDHIRIEKSPTEIYNIKCWLDGNITFSHSNPLGDNEFDNVEDLISFYNGDKSKGNHKPYPKNWSY